MNSTKIIAYLDDFQMSAYLAKLVSLNDYQLHFFDENEKPNIYSKAIFIIDVDCISSSQLKAIVDFKKKDSLFILGYKKKMDIISSKEYLELGYDSVFDRKKLIKNLVSIVNKISNG